jgi:hypothetical protein
MDAVSRGGDFNTRGQGVSLGVSCTSVADFWAVGDTQQPSIAQGQPLIAHYNGINLTADNTPNPVVFEGGEMTAVLNGVFCVRAADCWRSAPPTRGRNTD